MTRRITASLVVLVAIAMLSGARVRSAVVLSFSECVEDNDTGVGECPTDIDGLDDPFSIAVSRDGRSVYVASLADDALTLFSRNTKTGRLTAKGCIDDNDTGDDGCAVSVDGLGDPIESSSRVET